MAAKQIEGGPESIALVDLSYLFKKNWHGVPRDAAPGAAAQQTLDQLAGIRESVGHVIVCLDAPPYRRKEISVEYKAQRERPADEELSQKKWLLERIERDGYSVARAKGYEADDVIATLCMAYDTCPDVRIIGADKDCAQCVTDRVRMFVPSVGSRPAEVRGPAEVRAKFGVDPKDMGLWLALVGDASDNIPGVPGIGAKKAAELIQNCVNLIGISEALAESVDDPKRGKMWDSLAAHWEQLVVSISLTRLELDVPVDAAALLVRREAQSLVEDEDMVAVVNDDRDDHGDEPVGEAEDPFFPALTAEQIAAGNAHERQIIERHNASVAREVAKRAQKPVSEAEFDPISRAPEGYVAPKVEPARAKSEPPKMALAKTSDVTEDLQPTTIDSAYRLAKAFHNGRMYQKYPSPEAIFTVLVKARELGLKATTALDCFSVIKGVPRASADLMQALAERDPDCEYFKLIESTPDRAVYRVKRKSHKEPMPDFVYTMDDARTAGLSSQDNYRKNPAAMMRARCKSNAARTAFPGACCGLYCPEELDAA